MNDRSQWLGLPTWRGLLAAAMVVLLVLSLLPPSAPLPSTGWDKTNHVLAFVVLAMLGRAAWPGRRWPVLLGLLAYGGLIEVLQSLTPDRYAEFGDLLADGVGLLVGDVCAVLLMRWQVVRR